MLLFYSFSEGQTLLHYWNFNNNASVSAITTPTQTNIAGASLTAAISGISAIDFTGGTAQNFNVLNLNARNSDASGTHLRFNDAIGSALVFALPTTGYENAIIKFATRRSSSGAGTQVWSYSTDGTNYTFFANVTPNNGDPGLATLDFSSISAADNNANFKLKVEFTQGTGGTAGNNRFDNFTTEGTLLAGSDSTAPTATFFPINSATNVTRSVNPTISFNENVRLLNNDVITNTNVDAVVELRLNNASGTLVPFDATFASNQITIVPTGTLTANQLYYIALLPNTIEDGSNNAITTLQSVTFTSSKPSVSLSVSTNAGSEVGTTAVTVTATADMAVNGDQTINLGVTGTNITAGDYTLNNSVITILNGQTTGSVTFTVVDDALVEGSEIATLTISNPSSGIVLGTTVAQSVTITDNDSALNIDLSTYVRVGRYDLPEPTRSAHPTNNLLCQEASAVAYNWDTDTLFITADGSTSITQVSKTGQFIDTMTMAQGGSPQGTEFYDTEGLTYIGNGEFVMSEERDRQLVKFTYAAGTTLTRANTQTVKIGTFVPNTGTEGLSYDPLTGGYIVLKEITPIGIFQTGVNFTAGTATNGSATTENSTNLFDPALLGFSDVADVFALSNIPSLNGQSLYNNLLVLGQENAKVVNIDRNGTIVNTLTIVSDAGNPLDVASQQHEGLTMDRNGILYIVSENGGGNIDHPQLWVYAPSTVSNQAPTTVALTNATNAILENSNTTAAVKVADIAVTDDGLGTNNLTLSGADASSFQITGSSLYIKAGTVLDYETKTSYSVTVNVDDTTIGTTPDASVNFVLNVTDVSVESTPIVSVSITEAAPWSSSTTNVAADWFEVTNNGNAALDITGWKVDDNSNSFSAALALTGITSIAPGESVIFLETSATNAATIIANFKTTWFGSNVPAGLQVGSYTGGGIGLGTGGDAVNLFNTAGVVQANISFGAATTNYTFNNAAGLSNTAITTLSQVGVNDAFTAANDVAQIGSPGTVGKLFISEVAPWSSGNSPVGADWFEVTNTKAVAVDITGWKVDDNSQSPSGAVALNGITSINPGESVIFMETADLAGKTAAFLNNWFGTNPSSGLRIGNYTGSGVGLGTSGDQVNLYNGVSSTPVSSVLFGASPAAAPYTTFDNSNGINGITTSLTQFSAVGTKGGFIAANSATEIGSPGTVVTAPCPTITATATPAASSVCTGATTTVSVTATGGTLPYVVTGSSLTVGGGTFNYTITDAKGCTATATATVTAVPVATVNLSVSTNTPSEAAGTVVTVTATTSTAVCADQTITVDVTGTGITAADYTLSNTTITIPSGATSGSVTFTVLNDNAVEALETAVLTISNPSSGIALGTTTTQNIAISDFVFTLQVLHASDFEGAVEAVQDAPRFAAIVDQLEESHVNTIKLSSGDNYIPGPFLSCGEDSSLSPVLKTAYESYYNTTFSSSAVNLLPSIGRADISILNFIGIEASALGNHEFDLGTTEIRNIIRGANSSSTVRSWFGAQFPYLSSNLNFSGDSNLSAIATTDRLRLNTSFMSNPTEAVTTITNKSKLAPSTIIMKGGQKIGIVGCTTQILASISSPGATTVTGGGENNMTALAGIVQPVVNALIADGCNKIILLSHLQQIDFEKDLATKLSGVDIIIAAGSNTLLADANDRLRAGDVAAGTYPFLATDLAGKTVPVVNTDGNYKYVGRLVVDFDSDGNLIPSSINEAVSGVYAADAQGLNDVWGANVANAYAVGTRGYQVKLLCDAIGNVITSKDGNLFGKTAVFLEGRRNIVRTEETNLGNLTAEANLWLAKQYDSTTVISIKNGGGIRSAIGNVIAVGSDLTLSPPIANVSAGKLSGDISQLDIENSLRFNNKLSLVTLTASGLRAVLEHAVAGTTATATPGQFAQVAGVRYSYNFSNAVGSRILNAVITDANGNVIDTLVVNGVTQGNLSRTFRVVTLNFLAGGGDSYPFTSGTNRVDLDALPEQGPAAASFTTAGSEQDAFAEYMKNQYSTTPYGLVETAIAQDCRIQRVPARADKVLPLNPGTNSTLSITIGTNITESQLFAALGGTPQTGGTWSPAISGSGVYTYTITSESCLGSASATVTVTQTIPTTMSFCAGAKVSNAVGTTTLKFYTAPTGGSPLLGTTVLSSKTFYATQTVNGNEILPRVAVAITVNALPTEVLGAITSNTPTTTGFAAAILAVGPYVGKTTTVSYRLPALVDTSLSYNWTVPAGVSIVGQAEGVTSITQTGADANVLNVNFSDVTSGIGTIGVIKVQAQNSTGCVGTAKSITVSKILPTAPIAIKMTDGTLPLPSNGIASAVTTFAPYMGTSKVLTLTATPVVGASSYQWELPTGVNQLTGGNSNVITVDFAGVTKLNTYSYNVINATTGIVTPTNVLRIGVKAINGVGTSVTSNATAANPTTISTARLLTLTAILPAAPAAIKMTNDAVSTATAVTVISKFIGTTTPLTLTATPSANASSYEWELPAGVNQLTGGTSNVITVDFENVNPVANSFYIGVKAVNGLGSSVTVNPSTLLPATTSTARLLKVSVALPAAVTTVAGQIALVCPGTSQSYTITAPVGATQYVITAPIGSVVTAPSAPSNATNVLTTTDLTFTVSYASSATFVSPNNKLTIVSKNLVGLSTTVKTLTLTKGTSCSPVSRITSEVSVAEEFSVLAYPNPSDTVFTIDVVSSIKEKSTEVLVYDMTGRLIEQRQIQSDTVQLGSNYATGVYNVFVKQDANVKILRLIKK